MSIRRTQETGVHVTARICAATFGSYAFSYALAAAAAPALPLAPAESALLVAMLSIVPVVWIAMAAFATSRVVRFCVVLTVATTVLWLVALAVRR